jgi:hypothetical protein
MLRHEEGSPLRENLQSSPTKLVSLAQGQISAQVTGNLPTTVALHVFICLDMGGQI